MGAFFHADSEDEELEFNSLRRHAMDEKMMKAFNEAINSLLPDSGIKIRSAADLAGNPNPTIRELCEAAELLIRLSKEERA